MAVGADVAGGHGRGHPAGDLAAAPQGDLPLSRPATASRARRLGRDFFDRPPLAVARDLVGCTLWAERDGRARAGRIVEVEAYGGLDDPASHAGRGPTPRSAPMFGPPAVAYVYLIYGLHHCLNFVTGPGRAAGAVLVRGLRPLAGLDGAGALDGPGKLCRALEIDLAWNGLSLLGRAREGRRLWLQERSGPAPGLKATPRVGIVRAAERPWRFLEAPL